MMSTWLLALLLLGQATLDQANKALLEGNYQQAYSLYQEVLKKNPDQYEALTNAAFTASKLGKTAEAFDLYWRAWQIKKDPQRVGKPLVDLGLQLGTRYTLEKKWSDAERVFRIVTNVAADNDVAWFNLGYALEQQGKLEEALTAYRRARDLNPSNTVIAAINRVQGELDRQRTARLNTFRRRAERALGRGDTTLALALMDSVLRLDPRNAWARSTRAQILEQQKTRAQIDSLRQVLAGLLATDSLKALPVVEQLLSLVPEDSQLIALRGELQALRQREIQEVAQTQKAEEKGFPVGLVVGIVVVLLLAIGAVLLLRGKKAEEVPAYQAPARPKPAPQTPPTPKPEPRSTPPPPPEPTPEPAATAPPAGTPGKIRVIEGIPLEEEGAEEEPTPRDVVIRGEKKPEPVEEPAAPVAEAPAEPEPKKEEPVAPAPPEPKAPEKRKEEPAPVAEEPAPEPVAEAPKEEEKVTAAEKPAPVAEEKPEEEKPAAPPEKKPEEKPKPKEPEKPAAPAAPAARPARARGFGGVDAIKERAKKKRRLMFLQMLRDALAEGKEGVFGSKELEAYIYMKEGKILQAEYKGKSGQEALQAILENPKPDRFSFREKDTFFVEGDLNITVDDLDRQIEELKKEV